MHFYLRILRFLLWHESNVRSLFVEEYCVMHRDIRAPIVYLVDLIGNYETTNHWNSFWKRQFENSRWQTKDEKQYVDRERSRFEILNRSMLNLICTMPPLSVCKVHSNDEIQREYCCSHVNNEHILTYCKWRITSDKSWLSITAWICSTLPAVIFERNQIASYREQQVIRIRPSVSFVRSFMYE
jgi:hypothetical protein